MTIRKKFSNVIKSFKLCEACDQSKSILVLRIYPGDTIKDVQKVIAVRKSWQRPGWPQVGLAE